MYINIQSRKITDGLKVLLISFFVIIGTFPGNDWSFTAGIDGPLAWVFNYLFENGLSIGKHIIFPHGPLAFFMYPLQENILLSRLVNSILKALLVFNVFCLFPDSKDQVKWLVSFLIAYFISIIAGFNHLILANILLLYCNFYHSNKKGFKYLAFFITSFAFFVKTYVAVLSGMLSISFILYYFFRTKKYKHLLIDILLLSGFIMMFWILMYGTFKGFMHYVLGMFHLVMDNSSAVAYYPYNDWLILTLFLLVIISVFIVNRTKRAAFYGILISLSLFAAWKHGMAREDIYHVKDLFNFLILCFLVFIFFHKKNSFTNLILSIAALFLFSINMMNSNNYSSAKHEIFRVNNFARFVTEFNDLNQKAIKRTESEISKNKLPRRMLDSISNSTVDIYPWDYSIIPANKLNWQPRVIIHSYASYTSWLDQKNAEHFDSESAPAYIVWEKILSDVNGGDMNSIDNRYLLNDEPQTILSILSNYDLSLKGSNFMLLKKRASPLQIIRNVDESSKSIWGEWINVPENKGSLLRAKLNFRKTFLQRVKSFFYKDEQFWIYFKLDNGSIHKYRIVPINASDGLWINPFIFSADQTYTVSEIMFKCSNQRILTSNLTVDWEQVDFKDNPCRIDEFFDVKNYLTDSLMIYSINDFGQPLASNWSNLSDDQLSDMSLSGLKSHLLKANSFSTVFTYKLDSIPYRQLKITTDCWVQPLTNKLSNDISLVLSVANEKENIIWKSIPIAEQIIDYKQWNNVGSFIVHNHVINNCTLKAFVWNTGNHEILIDDFRVMIMTSSKP